MSETKNTIPLVQVEKTVSRQKVGETVETMLSTGIDLLKKEDYERKDFVRIKILRTLSSPLNSAVALLHQQIAQTRNQLVAARMEQLGFTGEKQIT